MFCAKCGKDLPAEAVFCPSCGAPVKPGSAGGTGAGGEVDEIGLFVGKNAAFYTEQFRKFNVGGVETFVPSWNWAACLCNFWWMLYRKLYLWALVWFFLSLIPFFGIVFWIAAGIAGNYLYYKHAASKIREARSMSPPERLPEVLGKLGGVNEWVVIVGIVVTAGMLILAVLFGIGVGLFCTFARKGMCI